jgi:hypothetical protein
MVNERTWRCCRECVNEYADATGTTWVRTVDEHDRIGRPRWRLRHHAADGRDHVIHLRREICAHNGHLNASPCEDQLKGERCAERIGIGTLVRDNPHSLCRGKQLQ